MTKETIAILGGTGPEGAGLAMRWAAAGYSILIGSRDSARAEATAAELRSKVPGGAISGAVNREAADLADLVVLSADPRALPPEQLHTLRAEMTVVDGVVRHEA